MQMSRFPKKIETQKKDSFAAIFWANDISPRHPSYFSREENVFRREFVDLLLLLQSGSNTLADRALVRQQGTPPKEP